MDRKTLSRQASGLMPTAYEKLFEMTNDVVLVVDAQDRVIELNLAGREALDGVLSSDGGLSLSKVIPDWPRLAERAGGGGIQTRITLDGQNGQRHFQVSLSPLGDHQDHPAGRLVVMREVTAHSQDRESLLQSAYAELKAQIQEQVRQRMQEADDLLESRINKRTTELVQANMELQLQMEERLFAEEMLRESEERLRTLHESLPVAIWHEDWTKVVAAIRRLRALNVTDWYTYFWDHQTRVSDLLRTVKILDINRRMLGMFEAGDQPDILTSLGTVLRSYDTLPVSIAELTALAEGRQMFFTEMTVDTLQGNVLHMLLSVSFPRRGSTSGQLLVTAIDITARIQAEKEVQENREWLRVTLNSIHDGVLATDTNGHVVFLNPVAEALTGWTAAEALGQPVQRVFDVIDEKTRQPVLDVCSQVLSDGHPVSLADGGALLARDGREIPITNSAAPILDANGNVAGMVLTFHDVTDKRRAQQTLRESEERFRSVLENSLDVAYRRNLQTDRYDYMSPVFETITGWSVDEMNRFDIDAVLDLIHPDDRPLVEREIERTTAACQAGLPAIGALEYRFRGKDGIYHWLGDHINVLPGSDGRPLYRLGIVRDISTRKQQEQELLQLNRTLRAHSHSDQAQLRAISEAEYMQEVCRIIVEDCGHAMVWIGFAEDDEYQSVRPVAYAGFEEGYLETLHITWADTELGRGPTGLAVRTGLPSFCRDMLADPRFEPWRKEALKRGYASSLVLPLFDDDPYGDDLSDKEHPAGRRAFGALTIYLREPDAFTDDEIALLSDLADDLSYGIRVIRLREAHARAEQELRSARDELEQRVQERTAELQASEERFRQLAENIDEVFWLLEPETRRVLYVSPAYEAIWGRSVGELYEQPQSFLDTVHPGDRDRLVQGFTSTWQAYDGEFRIIRPDGAVRWIQLSSFPVYNDEGQVYRLGGVAVDRTEQKAAQVALIQAERLTAVGKMAASMAHEINNPLQSVIGCLGLAQGATENGQDPARYLQVAYQEVRRTARIVSQLHAMGRPVEGKKPEPTDLNCLLSDLLTLNKKHLESAKIEVLWEPDDDLSPVSLVADSIHQVFLNLVLNAADAMPTGGQLRLSTTRTESPAGVRVQVTDIGSGISPEVLPHIFEAFYSTKQEGMGMGLFISYSIVQQHGGHIEVESTPGAGTTFTVWLPGEMKTREAQAIAVESLRHN